MRIALAHFPPFSFPRVRRWGHLAALLALTACFDAPGMGSSAQARAQFAARAYCPAARVHAYVMDEATPPDDVAQDPERLAIWRAVAARRASERMEWRVAVEGCAHHAVFVCSDGAPCTESFSTLGPRPVDE